MTDFVRIVLVCVIGLALGLTASAFALSDLSPFDRARLGAWSLEAHAGSSEADPYTRARLARSGEIPLSIGEGLQLIARADDEGRPLDARCVYRIGPRAPAARYWTLSLVDARGFPVANPAERYGFRSSEILRAGDGEFLITVAADAQPGNWLPIGAPGPFALVLRLYDSPLGGDRRRDRALRRSARDEGRLPMTTRSAARSVVLLAAAASIWRRSSIWSWSWSRPSWRRATPTPGWPASEAERDRGPAPRRARRTQSALRRPGRGDGLLPLRSPRRADPGPARRSAGGSPRSPSMRVGARRSTP